MHRIAYDSEIINCLDAIDNRVNEINLHWEKKRFQQGIENAEHFQHFLDVLKNMIQTEIKGLKARLDNVNLYYQNFMVKRATIAFISLGIATLAFLLAILQTLIQLHII